MWRKMTSNSPNVFKIFKNTHNPLTEPEFPRIHQYCCHTHSRFELDKSCKQINIEHSQILVGNVRESLRH